jgi:L-sorbose 1-phosphate reductase
VEAGELATDRVVAAVGGIETVRDGLDAVANARFLGKTVIYPQCRNLPLLSVAELAERHPEIREQLRDGRYWTAAAEAALLKLYGAPRLGASA